jgi:hypothetical protein
MSNDRPTTPAYRNWGRWVVDCPTDGCTNAKEVRPGQTEFVCDNAATNNLDCCGGVASVEWPDNPAAVVASLAGRPTAHQSQHIPGSPQDIAAREAGREAAADEQ